MSWRAFYECDFCQAVHEIIWQTEDFEETGPCTRCNVGVMRLREKESNES